MAQPFGPKSTIDEQNISAAKIDHLPIVKHYAQRLGVPTKNLVRIEFLDFIVTVIVRSRA